FARARIETSSVNVQPEPLGWSPASRGRGLKRRDCDGCALWRRVARFARARIETTTLLSQVGCGVVARFARARIETRWSRPWPGWSRSPASRGRGLKQARDARARR